jgi:NADH-quinone oxidoreductase subunit C
MDSDTLVAAITGIEPAAQPRGLSDRPAIRVAVEKLLPLLQRLRDSEALAFDLLLDHTAIDWPEQDRFELVYRLYSTRHGHDLAVCADVPRSHPVAPTASALWPAAEYQEREVYDLFGIQYDEHPDLRRVFLEDDWEGFPLRKDYQDPDMLDDPRNT